MRHIIDKGLEKLVSRKLMAWATATWIAAVRRFGIQRLGNYNHGLYWWSDNN